ncbi:hypothetical protein BS17DRAFT_739680 [Gyrodon lividus]|nr:hypothetical protein BS17DRAFT_739680 [Gyrodon lividus]
MTSLPRELAPRLTHSVTIAGAYPIILQFEKSAKHHKDHRRLIYARILGYLILEGPSDYARVAVAQEVISCEGDEEKLAACGKLYCDHYIRAFRKYKGRTPAPSSHPSRPSFDSRKALIMYMLKEAPQSHQNAKRKALVRDNFSCVVSGSVDLSVAMENAEVQQMVDARARPAVETHCAHIFAESTNENISGNREGSDKHQYAASMWAVMDRFGYKHLPSDLNGANIHRLENILTLESNIHNSFDRLNLWFEPTDTPNTYNIRWKSDWLALPYARTTVTFTSSDLEKLPLPSPEYLQIHAACAKVAHLSGAGDYIDKILRDLEDIQVLSEDGASADVLEHALLPLGEEIRVF